jgi:hypothetical protein
VPDPVSEEPSAAGDDGGGQLEPLHGGAGCALTLRATRPSETISKARRTTGPVSNHRCDEQSTVSRDNSRTLVIRSIPIHATLRGVKAALLLAAHPAR